MVVDSDNKVFYADTTNPQHLGRVSGVTLHAVVAGGVVTVVRTGPIYEPSWNWVPDQAVYLADNGLLTQTPPTGFFQQVIGVAIDSTSLYVNLRPPLVVT